MSQSSTPENPSNPPAEPTPRRLISPAERFAEPAEPASHENAPPVAEPFVVDPFVPEPSSRRDEEMARRHMPPRERRKHERMVRKRQKRDAHGRSPQDSARPDSPRHESPRHEQRAQAEREFAQQARIAPPKPAVKTRRRLPVWLKRLFLLVALLFLGQLTFAALTAPQFEIKSVSITGVGVTPQVQLHTLAHKLQGQNFFRVNRKATEKAVEAIPTVAAAHVVRLPSWPPKVQLRIEERQPVLQVGAGNEWWVVDAQGVPFRRATAEDDHLYQVVAPEFRPHENIKMGVKLEARAWRAAFSLNEALRSDNRLATGQESDSDGENKSYWQLRRIYFDKDGLASLRLTGRGDLAHHNELLLRLGDDRWADKLARARVALSYFEKTGRRAQELDLVSLERPVWLPVPAQLAVEGESTGNGDQAG